MSSHRWLIWWLIPTHILNKMVSHLIMMLINPPKLTRDLDAFWVWLLLLFLMVKVNQCLLRMICYMLRFFELAQQVIYHNYVAYNFFEQSIFILSYWIGYADSITIVVMNAFFWHYSYQKYVYRDPEGCFEIAYLGRCLQPAWFISHKSDMRFAGHLT